MILKSERALRQWEYLDFDLSSPEAYIQSLNSQLPENSEEDYSHFLLKNLKPRLSDKIKSVLDKNLIVFGEINAELAIAQMVPCSDGRYAIVITSGLRKIYYRVIRALSSRIATPDANVKKDDFSNCCRVISDIAFWYKNSLESFGPDYSISNEQINISAILTNEAMTFCLAHEIAHALFLLDEELNHLAVGGKEEEFFADSASLGIILLGKENNSSLFYVYAGAILFFRIQQMFERFGFEFANEEHPSFEERRITIMNLAKSFCESTLHFTVLSNIINPILELIDVIENESNEHESLQRAGEEYIKELDNLLNDCTGGFVPNYFGFYQKAIDLLNKPYTEFFLNVFKEKIEDFAKIIVSESIASSEAEKWRAFQKYKLLLGLNLQLSEPARTIFMNAFNESAFQKNRT